MRKTSAIVLAALALSANAKFFNQRAMVRQGGLTVEGETEGQGPSGTEGSEGQGPAGDEGQESQDPSATEEEFEEACPYYEIGPNEDSEYIYC